VKKTTILCASSIKDHTCSTVLSLGLCAIAVMLYHGQSCAPHAPSSSMPLSSVTGSSSFSTADDIIAPAIVAVYKQKYL